MWAGGRLYVNYGVHGLMKLNVREEGCDSLSVGAAGTLSPSFLLPFLSSAPLGPSLLLCCMLRGVRAFRSQRYSLKLLCTQSPPIAKRPSEVYSYCHVTLQLPDNYIIPPFREAASAVPERADVSHDCEPILSHISLSLSLPHRIHHISSHISSSSSPLRHRGSMIY